MEYLVLAVILYFILQTTGNLVRLLGGDENASVRDEAGRERSGRRQTDWEGPSPRRRTGPDRDDPTYWGKDVDDATWRDL